MTEPYTAREIRDQFFAHIESMVDYWDRQDLPCKGRLEGLVHSIFCMIDGSTMMPAFRIAVDPAPEDRAFYESEGEQWYPCSRDIKLPGDITDRDEFLEYLHHEWARRRTVRSGNR